MGCPQLLMLDEPDARPRSRSCGRGLPKAIPRHRRHRHGSAGRRSGYRHAARALRSALSHRTGTCVALDVSDPSQIQHQDGAEALFRKCRLMGAIIVSGLVSGALYALIASGLSLVWGALGVFNFAHGVLLDGGRLCRLVDFGAGGTGARPAGWHRRGVAVPHRRRDGSVFSPGAAMGRQASNAELAVIMTTIAGSIFMQNLVLEVFGGRFKTSIDQVVTGTISLAGTTIQCAEPPLHHPLAAAAYRYVAVSDAQPDRTCDPRRRSESGCSATVRHRSRTGLHHHLRDERGAEKGRRLASLSEACSTSVPIWGPTRSYERSSSSCSNPQEPARHHSWLPMRSA